MTTQATRTRKTKKEAKRAEDFIAEATEAALTAEPKPKRTRRKKGEWPCTAEDVVRERDQRGLSWAQVAANLGLGGPGQARTAYAELTGRNHQDSQPLIKRAPKGTARRKVNAPEWDDDSDQEAIEASLNGAWLEESGSGATYQPARWSGSAIQVRHQMRGSEFTWDEDVLVKRVEGFTFGANGDQPLQVTLVEKVSGAFRTFFVASILEVR